MSSGASPNADLVGKPGSRTRLATPALVLDLDALERNLHAMAVHCRRVGLALRPHAKTHKSIRIARLQLEAGAVGVCCATIGEAEVMVNAGIPGVLVTSPVVPPTSIERLVRLHANAADLRVVADHPTNVAALAAAVSRLGRGHSLRVVVDFDPGLGRTGTATEADALALARLVAGTAGLEFAGVQAYAGHLQHIESFASRTELADEQLTRLASLVAALRGEGLAPSIVSGGGTGTHDIEHRAGVFSELQAGSYAVMDVEYGDVELTPHGSPFEPALFVQSTVISANARGWVTTDAGLKRFATDGPKPRLWSGAPEGAVYALSGDEHGCVVFADASQTLPLAAVVSCVVPHCDPTVNLYDEYHCVRGDVLVDLWPVDARGAA